MMVVNKVSPETFYVPATAHSPNSKLPVVVYRNALVDKTPAGALEAMETSEWIQGGHWKIAKEPLAATPHYHATTHEAYTVLHGTGSYLLGRSPLDPEIDGNGHPLGVEFTVSAGDVFAFPSGVTHFVTGTKEEYEIIGFYSLSGRNSKEEPYDMHYGKRSVEETERMRDYCNLVPTPVHDPIYGKEGPMTTIWKRE